MFFTDVFQLIIHVSKTSKEDTIPEESIDSK